MSRRTAVSAATSRSRLRQDSSSRSTARTRVARSGSRTGISPTASSSTSLAARGTTAGRRLQRGGAGVHEQRRARQLSTTIASRPLHLRLHAQLHARRGVDQPADGRLRLQQLENRSMIPFGHLRNPAGQLLIGRLDAQFLSFDYASSLRRTSAAWTSVDHSLGGQLFQDNLSNPEREGDEFSGPVSRCSRAREAHGQHRHPAARGERRAVRAGAARLARPRCSSPPACAWTATARSVRTSGSRPIPRSASSYVLSDHGFWPARRGRRSSFARRYRRVGQGARRVRRRAHVGPIAGDEGKPGFSPEPDRQPEARPGAHARAGARLRDERVRRPRDSLDFTYFDTRTHRRAHPGALSAVAGLPQPAARERRRAPQHRHRGPRRGSIRRVERRLARAPELHEASNSEATDLGDEPQIAIGTVTEVRKGYPGPVDVRAQSPQSQRVRRADLRQRPCSSAPRSPTRS